MKDEIEQTMKTERVAVELMKDVELTQSDIARLILETIELLGDLPRELTRLELINLLRDTLRAGVEVMKSASQTVTLSEAAWASVEARKNLRPASLRDLRHFIRRILRVEDVGELSLRSMTSSQCRHILAEAFGASQSSYVKGRAVLHSVFAYGIRQEWCDANPVTRIEVPKVQENPIKPLAPAEVDKLKLAARRPEHRDMRFSLSLLLYSGLRPAEVSRLQMSDISWEEQIVIIRPQVSKTGGGRIVPLRGVQGLRQEDCRIPRDWERKWHALRHAAGFATWQADACRHTFASYHAAYFRNIPELQLEMGHRDATLLRSRYMAPALKKDAVVFWRGAGL